MSYQGRHRSCVFGCSDLGAYRHGFPHPEKRSELFRKWVSIVGNKLTETDPMKIYKNKKVCAHHFTMDQKVASHRLMCTAVPSVHLEGIISSPIVFVQLEHNYCIPGIQSPKPGVCSTNPEVHSTDTELIDQQPRCIHCVDQPPRAQMLEKDKSSEHLLKELKAAQREIRILKAQLRKTKNKELNYQSHVSAMPKALSDNSALFKQIKTHEI